MDQPRVLFFGLPGEFSKQVFWQLMAHGVDVCGLVTPAGSSASPIQPITPPTHPLQTITILPSNLIELAHHNHIPVFAISDLTAPETRACLAQLKPDIACVACFNQRIPSTLLQLPPHGFLNVHPSLLPAYRGSAPLFWLWRYGAAEAMGVTIHKMDEQFDTGEIVLQQPLMLPDGIPGRDADKLCGQLGGELLVQAIEQLKTGQITSHPQPAGGSYHPYPKATDFQLDPNLSAQQAFNFMRGTAEWGYPYHITVGKTQFQLRTAHSYTTNSIELPLMREGGKVGIRFRPGTLWAS